MDGNFERRTKKKLLEAEDLLEKVENEKGNSEELKKVLVKIRSIREEAEERLRSSGSYSNRECRVGW